MVNASNSYIKHKPVRSIYIWNRIGMSSKLIAITIAKWFGGRVYIFWALVSSFVNDVIVHSATVKNYRCNHCRMPSTQSSEETKAMRYK